MDGANRSGYPLIEILIVMAVVGMLLAVYFGKNALEGKVANMPEGSCSIKVGGKLTSQITGFINKHPEFELIWDVPSKQLILKRRSCTGDIAGKTGTATGQQDQ